MNWKAVLCAFCVSVSVAGCGGGGGGGGSVGQPIPQPVPDPLSPARIKEAVYAQYERFKVARNAEDLFGMGKIVSPNGSSATVLVDYWLPFFTTANGLLDTESDRKYSLSTSGNVPTPILTVTDVLSYNYSKVGSSTGGVLRVAEDTWTYTWELAPTGQWVISSLRHNLFKLR